MPKPATPERLEKAAYAYLERFAASRAGLARVLWRRVRRSADLHGTDPAEGQGWIDAIVERFARAGLVDDASYAAGRAASLARRGDGPRKIALKLAQQGIDEETRRQTLDALAAESGDLALEAAMRLARRRRLGPYRAAENRAAYRDKDLAALARAGHDFDTARTVIEARDETALDDLLDERAESDRV